MKLASNVDAAQEAVSGFADIHLDGDGQQASCGSSNISGMRDGASVANKLVKRVSELVVGVKLQADNVPALAMELEERDSLDARGWGGR